MDLKIKDVAELLNVSETTIRRWLAERKIPAYRLHHQYRFSRIEIENWMMSCRLEKGRGNFLPEETKETSHNFTSRKEQVDSEDVQKKGLQQFGLYRAIHRGGVFTEFTSESKDGIIRETMEAVAEDLSLDPTVLTDLLLDRERLMPTALNNGIAVPHTRDFLLKGPTDVVIVVFPKKPIAWGALDDAPVHTLFFLFASDDKKHLHLLAKLAHFSSNDGAIERIRSNPNKKELLNYIKDWESKVLGQS